MSNRPHLDTVAATGPEGRATETATTVSGGPWRSPSATGAPVPSIGIAFAICGAAYVAAAIVIAAVHVATPIAHGWWLVSYLVLVGGIAQALLGTGLAVLAASSASGTPTWAQLALWNAGTVTVAVADVAAVSAGVLVGSVLLLAALALFARSCARIVPRLRRRSDRAWAVAYFALVAFLAGSVVVGAGLAGALPGQ
jgi:hypothetical protein